MANENDVLKLLANKQSRMILQQTMEERRSAEELSCKLNIPLSTIYRKIKELRDKGLLVIEKSGITKDVKICDLYWSTIKGMNIKLNSKPVLLNLILNEEVHDKILCVWSSLKEKK